jgi:predicted DNA-binding protein (MmcQ/YjbR family)
VQGELAAEAPERFFRPPYVGVRGWLGVRLDGRVDWDEIAELCQDAYRVVAPATLIRQLDN